MAMECLDRIKQVVHNYVKQAEPSPDEFYQAVQAISTQQLQEQALRNAGTTALAGLGVGAGARGLMGLLQLGRRNLAARHKDKAKPLSIIDLHLPTKQATYPTTVIPQPELPPAEVALPKPKPARVSGDVTPEQQAAFKQIKREWREARDGAMQPSSAAELAAAKATNAAPARVITGPLSQPQRTGQWLEGFLPRVGPLGGPVGKLIRGATGAPAGPVQPPNRTGTMARPKQASISSFLSGSAAKTPAGIPWAIPAAVAGGAAGLYGGWKGVDALLDSRRRSDVDSELEEAKKDYERALEEPKPKQASDSALATALNALTAEFEKAALDLGDSAGRATGLYAVGAGTAAGLGAILAYQYGKKRQRRSVLEKAQKRLQRQRYMMQPPPLFAGPKTTPGEEEVQNDLFAEL